MIISKKYAKALINQGKADVKSNLVPDENGTVYTLIYRYDIGRTDHFKK